MFLKGMTINGFKSFANRTDLEFVQGITAVVGPNGSGKSNISDSIRWVLGEQSAKSLRGGKMEDVIFAGSDTRKKVNFAEVSLTLDNSDRAIKVELDEITVTRRVHRNGDSEYLINKQPCRLKDITELFLDTGIGKEAYSIIGQGRIEEILSSKSEDRRQIFEEAAGIVKYKHRKREAERKLDDTETNLLRIYDLISELESQLEPLKDQAEKAVLFKQYREQLKQHELSLSVYQIQEIHRLWTEATASQEWLQLRQAELAAVVSTHDAQLESQRLQLRKLEEEVDRLQADFLHTSESTEKNEGVLHVLQERYSHAKQHLAHGEQASLQLSQRLASKRDEWEHQRAKAAEVSAVLDACKAQLTLEELQLSDVAERVSTLSDEQLKEELLDTLNELAHVRNEIRYAEQQRDLAVRQQTKLQESKAECEHWLEELRISSDRTEQRLAQLREEMKQTEASRTDVRQQRLILLDELAKAERAFALVRQEIASLQSRKETMHELQNDYEGYAFGVKELLKNKDRQQALSGIHGAVAELIQVPAKVETAVEIALGGALQHLIVSDERSARQAIQYLKQRNLGRATFLPLDVIQPRSIPAHDLHKLKQADGFVGIASELIVTESHYLSIVQNLLGAVIIAEKLEQANRLAAACSYRYRVVTLDGDVVNAGGSMSGGSLQKKTGQLLSRQRLIDELGSQLNEKLAGESALEMLINDIKNQLQEADSQIEQWRLRSEQQRLQEQEWQAHIQQMAADSQQHTERMQWLEYDAQETASSIQASIDQIGREQQRKETLSIREQQLQTAIEKAQSSRKQQEHVQEQMKEQVVELKIKLAQARQEQMSVDEQIARIEGEIEQLRAESGQNDETISDWNEQIRRHERDIERKKLELTELHAQKQQLSEQLAMQRAARFQAQTDLEQEENHTREQRQELREVDEQLHQTEVKLNRYDVELELLLKKLSEDYELSFELAQKRYPIPDDVPATQQLVKDLKRQIQGLGDVNLGAIDEYARISERFDFLSTQKADLVSAKQTLYDVIREINEEIAKRFVYTFEQIRGRFGGVFSSLFGGGRADLILSDPQQILTTGIEIVAQPPGKSLKNLQLLSGGERALTAIALLFSILHIKPVPFCVLDEVEAALDEANVSRFAQYLREFSQKTQFIVVTHRKGTMEEADVLYGVTMQDSGVSKLVSVKLEEEGVL